jgi:hypothetical protein
MKLKLNDKIRKKMKSERICELLMLILGALLCSVGPVQAADLADQWYRSDCNAGNNWCSGTDRDGNVQIDDLKTFAEEWLAGI